MADRVQTIIRDFHQLLDTNPKINTIVDDIYNVTLGLQSATPLTTDFSLITKFIQNDVIEYFLLLDPNNAYALFNRYIQQGNSIEELVYISRYYQELASKIHWHKRYDECISPINTEQCKTSILNDKVEVKSQQNTIARTKKYHFNFLQLVYIGYQIITLPFLITSIQKISIWLLSLCQFCCIALIIKSQKNIKSTYLSNKNSRKKDHLHTCNDHIVVNPLMQFTWRRCEKCKLVQNKKQVHCRYCDVCIDDFDHHCHFLSQCITKKNYYIFILMIIFVMVQSFTMLVFMGLNKLNRTLIIPQIICYLISTGIILLHIGNIRRV